MVCLGHEEELLLALLALSLFALKSGLGMDSFAGKRR